MPTARKFPLLRNDVAGVPVTDLVALAGTPVYVYDAATIVERGAFQGDILCAHIFLLQSEIPVFALLS